MIRPAIIASTFAIAAAIVVLPALDGSEAPELQAPPWGFVGSWHDYCYRPLGRSPHYAVNLPSKGEPCPPGSTRIGSSRQIGLTVRAGATTDRLAVFWGAVEPKPPVTRGGRRVHAYSWAPVMKIYRAMLSADIQPVVLATGSPKWARQRGWRRPGACRARHGKSCSYPPSRRHLSDWRAFLTALIRRLPRMRALEVWNEPNLRRFFAPRPSPALYSRLLGAAGRAARLSRVPVTIVTGGVTSGASRAKGGIPAPRFLARIYALAGAASFEGIGAHPYPRRPPWAETMSANLDQLRQVRDQFGDPATPLWITEVGIGGTAGGRGKAAVDLARQGPVLARMYRAAQRSDVRAFIFYALRETPVEGPKFEPFGVVRANLRPKPAYCYLAVHLGTESACGGEP